MQDAQIHESIEKLVAEEHELWEREAAGVATEVDRQRLDRVTSERVPKCVERLRHVAMKKDGGADQVFRSANCILAGCHALRGDGEHPASI